MSQESTSVITMLVLILLALLSILAAFVWLVVTDQKAGFDEAQARKDAEEILKDAANDVTYRRRVRAGSCVGDWS